MCDRTSPLAWYGVAVLVVATVFGAMDRQILILLAEPLRHSLQLSDTQLGLLQGMGFSLFSGLAAVPVGWLADRYGRRVVLSGCVVIWTAATVACGLADSFAALFGAAAGMGVGEAAIVPIVYGLLPELVAERHRSVANGVYALAVLLGGGVGVALAGLMLQNLDTLRALAPWLVKGPATWRLAFMCVAVPGPVIAALILTIGVRTTTVTNPATHSDGRDIKIVDYLRANLRTLFSVFGGIGLAQLGLAASAIWLPAIAARKYGTAASAIGQGTGAAYVFGTLGGAAVGALLMPRLRRRLGLVMPTRVIFIGLLIAAFVVLAFPLMAWPVQLYCLFGLEMAAVTAPTLLVPTLLQDITPPLLRSRAIAAGSLVMIVLTSAGPVLVGLLSDLLRDTSQRLPIAVASVGTISLAAAAVLLRSAEGAIGRTVMSFNPGAQV